MSLAERIRVRGPVWLGKKATAKMSGRLLGAICAVRLKRCGRGLSADGWIRMDVDRGSSVQVGDDCRFGRRVRLVSVRFQATESASRLEIGSRSHVKDDAIILAQSGIVELGERCGVGHRAEIHCHRARVTIGQAVRLAAEVYITTNGHEFSDADVPIMDQGSRHQDVRIGDDVWIATESVLVAGAVVPDGVVVGARSVIAEPLEPWTIATGAPAKSRRKRPPFKVSASDDSDEGSAASSNGGATDA